MRWGVVPAGPGEFRGHGDEGPNKRIFGGQIAAQALRVAGTVCSLKVRFVREGRGDASVDYRVSAVGELHRQVTAGQDGRTILTLDARLSPAVSVPSWTASAAPAGWTPDRPDDAAWLHHLLGRMPFDFRFVGPPSPIAGRRGEPVDGQAFWFRTRSRLPDSPIEHQCALTYVSDLLLVSTALAKHGLAHGARPGLQSASLDHAVWFHGPFRADQWLLYEQETLTTGGGRGLCSGRLSDQDGRLVASVRQEVLIRLR